MTSSPHILVYSPVAVSPWLDQSILFGGAYITTSVSNIQAIDSWLSTFVEDALLVIDHPSPGEGLKCSEEIIQAHPQLPVILVTQDCDEASFRQALRIGLVDLLPIPFEAHKLDEAISRGLDRQKYWHEWNQLNQVLTGLRDGVIVVDMDLHLLLLNPAARELFCLADEPLVGRLVSEVCPHPDLMDLFTARGSFPHRGEVPLDDGRVLSAQASLIPNIGIAAIFHEITHLKKLDQIKTDFVNTVSHDLRSPLTAIYGFVGLIDRVGPVNEQQAEFIRHIQASVQHITSLINDLLELGRVEADHDIQMEVVNLKEIIESSIKNVDYQLNEKMQVLDVTIPDVLPPILGNPIHLQRMLINLVENAIKFTPTMGKIQIECRAEVNQLILAVSDNGHGIPLDEQPFIFDKFYRGSNLSENTAGTGLGLSIVKTIIEKHHGRIWVESSPGIGTTFTVILPLK